MEQMLLKSNVQQYHTAATMKLIVSQSSNLCLIHKKISHGW